MPVDRSHSLDWATYYDKDYDLPFIHQYLLNQREHLELCRSHCPENGRILEVGTGTGITSVYLSQLGYGVTGLDNNAGILRENRILNARYGGAATFVEGDAFGLPFSDGSFDLVFHHGLLGHFSDEDIVAMLTEHRRVGKTVVCTMPTRHWRGGLRGDERLLSGRAWLQLLRRFNIVAVRGASYASIATRTLHLFDRRIARGRVPGLSRALALNRAGLLMLVMR